MPDSKFDLRQYRFVVRMRTGSGFASEVIELEAQGGFDLVKYDVMEMPGVEGIISQSSTRA